MSQEKNKCLFDKTLQPCIFTIDTPRRYTLTRRVQAHLKKSLW